MNVKKWSDAMGELDSRYIEEAMDSTKKREKRYLPLIAACACLLLAMPLAAFAIDTIQYNAAVDRLISLGIPAEDLSDRSRKEIKEAARTIDAGESSPLTEELLGLVADDGASIETPADQRIDARHDEGRGPRPVGRYPGYRLWHLCVCL